MRIGLEGARCPPSRPSPATRGKETLPHAGIELAYCSVFLPDVWGRIEVGDKRLSLRAVPHPSLPPHRGGRRRCRMRVLSGHIAASSSPMYGGGLRWGQTTHLRAIPHPSLPPRRGGRRRCHMLVQFGHIAASSSPIYGGGPRWGTNDLALNRIEVAQTLATA